MTKLRYVLKQKSMSGRELAELCGVSRSTVYKYLSGDRKLSLKTARKFANVLDMKPEDLVGEIEL